MSITDTNKLRARVATLDKLLDDFDGQLDDLLAKSLPETLLGLDTIQQAKLQVTVPYLVYDLVIIYLKTKGIDPKTHPVFRELERVRGYIEKVSKAEKQESEQQRMTIDKAAANRFIKRAIAQAVRTQGQPSAEPANEEPTPGPSRILAQPVPAGATSKMLARVEWEKGVKEAEEEEEEDLEVFEETEDQANAEADVEMIDDETPAPPSLSAGVAETALPEQRPATTKKKKRPRPGKPSITDITKPTPENPSFTGRKRPLPPSETPTGDSEDPSASTSTSAPKNKKRKRNKRKEKAQTLIANAGGGETDTGTTSQSQSQSQSGDVSVASTPQVPTKPLPGVEAGAAAAGMDEKPRKWRKYNRKKKNANAQPAAETDAQS